MDPKVFFCLFLTFALSYALECSPHIRTFEEKTFPEGVYLSVTGSSSGSFLNFLRYSFGGNDQNAYFTLGPLIVQVEYPCKGCGGSSVPMRTTNSIRLPSRYNTNPPQPNSNSTKLDFQLGKSGTFFTKKVTAWTSGQLTSQVKKFHEELKCKNRKFIDKWYNVVYYSYLPYRAEIYFQKGTYEPRKYGKCAPDDSNIEKLCNGHSSYSCPNMTFGETNGVSVRNVSMYVVTGKAIPGVNCSFVNAQLSLYMGNMYYFQGNNTQHKKMNMTIPVMTESFQNYDLPERCNKEYQVLFYVNTADLHTKKVPCPIEAGMSLQRVENMQIYVKTVNGNPITDMSRVKDDFMEELNRKKMPFVEDRHYIAQYRGNGPMFGRTVEVWVEKYKPEYVTICEGCERIPVRPPMYALKPEAEPESSPQSMMIVSNH